VPDPGLREQLRLAKFNSSVCCGAVDEFLAGRLLERAVEILAERAAGLARSRAVVADWAAARAGALRWLPPDAGAIGCVQLGAAIDPGAFHARLAELGTAVAPGAWFGDSERVFRLGPGFEPPGRLAEGLAAITAALSE
jgi:DNA-binding transcriptional MocR family regulator